MKQPPVAGHRPSTKLGVVGSMAKALRATPAALELFRGFGAGFFSTSRSAYVDGVYLEATSATYAALYRSQENVRSVIDAIARVSADYALKCYKRDQNNKRSDGGDHPAAATLREPNDWQATRELIQVMIKDKLVYDDAYLWDMGADSEGRRFLVRVPPSAMHVGSNNQLRPTTYRINFQDGTWLDLRPDEVIHWRGYSAGDNRLGVPPMETLRTLIVEASVRKAQSTEQVKGGLIKGGIITRPETAPEWTEEAMERFSESFAARLRGVIAGETPVLEEGMQFHEAGITPREAEMLANRKYELEVVANVFGVNPAYFTTSGNLESARKQLREDVVTPMLKLLAETFTHQLIRGTYDDRSHFFRFAAPTLSDLSKLFEAGSKSTGGSVLTTNEFREDYLDKPPVPGGDEIVKHPGSQGGGTPPAPSSDPRGRPPNETEEQSVDDTEKAVRESVDRVKRHEERHKADEEIRYKVQAARRTAVIRRRDISAGKHAELLRNHFRRQKASTTPLSNARWNRELTADLLELAKATVEEEGTATAERLMGEFDMRQVENYLRAGAKAVAEAINMQTLKAYEQAVADAAAEKKTDELRDGVLDTAITGRSDSLGTDRATGLSSFAVLEAAKQNPGDGATVKRQKQWVWSGSPNSRHGGVANETVDLFEEFSNGGQFPGDAALGIEQTANCRCSLDVY